MNVLIVEDNQDHALLFSRLLGRSVDCSFESRHVRTIEEIADLKDFKIDIVCLDLGLGETKGVQTLRRFQKAYPFLPVVVLTSDGDTEVALESIQEGAQDYLVKTDVNTSNMERSIRYAVERWKLKERLEASLEAVGAFSSLVAHDLQSPLSTLMAHLDIIIEEGHKFPLEADRVSRRLANRMFLMVRGLLEFSQAVDSNESISTEPESFRSIVEDALENLSVHIGEKNAEIKKDFLDTDIVCSRSLMVMVMQNLIGNAIKYVKDVLPVVTIDVRAHEEMVKISVGDNGVGVPDEYKLTIFKPRERGDYDTQNLSAGNGLGLATVKRIIESHGGVVWVEDNEGGGSLFCFLIPSLSAN